MSRNMWRCGASATFQHALYKLIAAEIRWPLRAHRKLLSAQSTVRLLHGQLCHPASCLDQDQLISHNGSQR